MGQAEPTSTTAGPDGAWANSLRDVFRDVIATLPDHATLGDLIAAARASPPLAPVLEAFTVGELIDAARKRTKPGANGHATPRGSVQYDAEGNPVMDLGDQGALVIRRRADVPDGDIRLLRVLADRGPQRESDLAASANLSSEQLRIILRQLRSKGFIHVEGSGLKRRLKITRQGTIHLRKPGA